MYKKSQLLKSVDVVTSVVVADIHTNRMYSALIIIIIIIIIITAFNPQDLYYRGYIKK